MEAAQIDRAHPQAGDQLDGEGSKPQRLEYLFKAANLSRALLPQGLGQQAQIEHQMSAGAHRGGQGMNGHHQRKDAHGSQGANNDADTTSMANGLKALADLSNEPPKNILGPAIKPTLGSHW